MRKQLAVFSVIVLCLALTGCTKNPSEQGVEYLKNGQYKEAEEQFEKAIKEDINIGDAYRGLGLSKWEQESYEEAKTAFEKALKNDTDKTGTLYNLLGNCEMKLTNPEAALKNYKLALAAEGNSEKLIQEVKFNMIAAYEAQEDWESAKAQLAEYLAAYPDDENAKKESEFLETR